MSLLNLAVLWVHSMIPSIINNSKAFSWDQIIIFRFKLKLIYVLRYKTECSFIIVMVYFTAVNDILETLDLSYNHIRLRGISAIAKGLKVLAIEPCRTVYDLRSSLFTF